MAELLPRSAPISPAAVSIPSPTAAPTPAPTAVPFPASSPVRSSRLRSCHFQSHDACSGSALCHFQCQRPPAPTAMPLPAPTAVPLPMPMAMPLPAPMPMAMPLPAPTAVPLPTPGALPVPLVPLPMPTAVPLPTPAVVPQAESAALPFPAIGRGPNDPYWGVGVCLSRHPARGRRLRATSTPQLEL